MISTEQLRASSNPQDALQQQLPAAPAGETAGSVLAAQAVAVIQARTALAVARPRDLDVVRQRLLKECKRPGFADVAIYRKPIGKGVEGLSIRFVEAAIRCMGNVSTEAVAVYDDEFKRIVRVSVTDLEGNVPYTKDITIVKTIERRNFQEGDVVIRKRLNIEGKPVYILKADDDQILDKENALVSKAIRTEGLRLLPGDIADECESLCYRIRADKAAKDPDGERRAVIDGFAAVGVTVEQLKLYLGHDGTTLTPKELSTLRSLYVALRDEETTWAEIMENHSPQPQQKQPNSPLPPVEKTEEKRPPQPAEPTESDKAQGRVALAEDKQPLAAKTAEATKPLDDEFDMSGKAEEQPADKEGAITYGEIVSAISKATDVVTVSETIMPMIQEIQLPGQRKSLTDMCNNKIASLKRQQQQSGAIE